MVRPGGRLFIAIYNDEGRRSKAWRAVKQRYSFSFLWRVPIVIGFGSYILLKGFIKDVFLLRRNPMRRFREYKKSRGMSYFVDILIGLGAILLKLQKSNQFPASFTARDSN